MSSVEILEMRDNTFIKFVIHGIDLSKANALRRVLMVEVPCLAIDLVEFQTNTTLLHSEFLAHRLGMIPLSSSSSSENFVYSHECDCLSNVCPKCAVIFTLDMTNPSTSDTNLTVRANDLKRRSSTNNKKEDEQRVHVPQVNVHDPEDTIVLCKLAPGQQLQFTSIARKGIGKMHAKWSTCTVATYQAPINIQINEADRARLTEKDCNAIVTSCPRGVFKQNQNLQIEDAFKCTHCLECVGVAEQLGYPDLIRIEEPEADMPASYVFTVETTGVRSAVDVVQHAMNILREKAQVVAQSI